MIRQDQRGHRFHDRHRAGQHTRVVPPATSDHDRFARLVDRFLWLHDRRDRLKSDPKINIHPIGDAALDAAAMICFRNNAAILHIKRIVVFRAAHRRARKATAELKPFHGIDREHRFAEISVQFIENRLAEADGAAFYLAKNQPANRIARLFNFLD